MRLKVPILITIVFIINSFFEFYNVNNIKQISKYDNHNLDTSFSLLEISNGKSKRVIKDTDFIEESGSTSDSEIENKSQDLMDEEKKKKGNKLKKRLRRIPKFFRRIFRRRNSKAKSNNKNRHKKKYPVGKSVSIEQESTDETKKTVVEPETDIESPELNKGSDSKSKSQLKVADSIKPTQEELSNENVLEVLNKWEISKLINGMNNRSNDKKNFVDELKNKLKPQQGNHQQIDNLISEGDPNGEKMVIEMKTDQLYRYLDEHIFVNTGGITPIIKVDELISSINIDRILLKLKQVKNNIENIIKNAFQIENQNYRTKSNSLFEVYNQDFGQECTFSWMSDLIAMHYNAFMEFKTSEEDYQLLLDPRKSTPSERARNLSKTYYEMKSSKSNLRKILMKYLNCHIITFFSININDINIGKNEEKCTMQDLIILLYYKNIFQALKSLYNLTFKEKESDVSELNRMLISGFESLSEENKVKYQLLLQLSHKLLPLNKNAILYEKLIHLIDEKLSLCLAYIINNHQSIQVKL